MGYLKAGADWLFGTSAKAGAGAAATSGTSALSKIGTVLSTVSAGYGLYQALKGPPKASEGPSLEAAARVAEAEAQKKSLQRRRKVAAIGRQSTFKTDQMAGLLTKANTRKRRLLG